MKLIFMRTDPDKISYLMSAGLVFLILILIPIFRTIFKKKKENPES
jgi:hypothetical protein